YDPPDAVEQQFAGFGSVAPDRQSELCIIGNDVALRPRMEAADGDDRRLLRIVLTADEGLQRSDDPRGEDDWVPGVLRIGAMAANALHVDIDRVDIGEGKAARDANRARGKRRAVMESKQVVRL